MNPNDNAFPALLQGLRGATPATPIPMPPQRPMSFGSPITPMPPHRPMGFGPPPSPEAPQYQQTSPGDGITSFLGRITDGSNPMIAPDSSIGKLMSTLGGQTPFYDPVNSQGFIAPGSEIGKLLALFGSGPIGSSQGGTEAPF